MENKVIELSEEQRGTLERFVKVGVHSVHLVNRARIVLALDRSNKTEHLRINRICEAIGLSRQALNNIREDFLKSASVEDFLKRKKRKAPPNEPKITGEVAARIIAVACGKPPKGYGHWSLRLLGERIVELNILDKVSHMSIQRVLKKRNINLT
jgi:hypothetical protein